MVVGQLTLPMVRAGAWWSERTINGHRIPAQLIPGAALSSDGRRLALAHADGNGVTVVDLERLAVEQSVTADRIPTLLERLGLGTRPAHAKGMDGIVRRARFAADERTLYVWGSETRMEENGRMTERAEPLRVIDLERGVLVAELRTEPPVQEILASPDARSLYLGGHRTPDIPTPAAQPTYVLRRLDPMSLAILAEREFTGVRRILFGGSETRIDPGGLPTTG